MQNQLDPQIVNLTKAIRQVESNGNFQAVGKSGEYGAYQFTEPTWASSSKTYLGQSIPLKQATPEQQNEVAYKQISDWKKQGYNVGQIASMWNSGKPENYLNNHTGTNSYGVQYDTPTYAKNVATAYQQFKQQGGTQQPGGLIPTAYASDGSQMPKPNASNAGVDTPGQAVQKLGGNFIDSAWNFGKGVLNVLNPLNTLDTLSKIPEAFKGAVDANGGVSGALTQTAKALPGQAYQSLVPEAGRALIRGDLVSAQNAIVNDPVGQIAPFLLGAKGGVEAIDRMTGDVALKQNAVATAMGEPTATYKGTNMSGAMDNAMSRTAGIVTKPLGAITSGLSNILGGITKSATSHLTGLDPTTITTILENSEAFKKLQQDQISRGGLANEVGTAIDTLSGRLDETGSLYDPIRQSDKVVTVPEDFLPSMLEKYGLKLEPVVAEIAKGKKGELPSIQMDAPTPVQGSYKVVADSNSLTRNPGDIKAIQNFVDEWGHKTELTPNEYLNMRKDANVTMARFGKDVGKNADAQRIGQDIYGEMNRTVRPQIPGLKELDAEYSPIRQQFDALKKDYLQKDPEGGYSFKDGAIKKIANAMGSGKENLLARLEQLLPGITKKIQILKAVEDIEHAKGIKVGTYARGAIEGFAVYGAMGGQVGAVISAIVSNPAIAVPLLRGLGWGASKLTPVVSTLKMIAGDINHLKLPTAITTPVGQK